VLQTTCHGVLKYNVRRGKLPPSLLEMTTSSRENGLDQATIRPALQLAVPLDEPKRSSWRFQHVWADNVPNMSRTSGFPFFR
jgi:hypothetical protein